LEAAVEQMTGLAEPHDESFFVVLRKAPGRLRYVPALLRGLHLDAAPAGRAVLEAIRYLCTVQDGGRRPGPAPTAFVSKAWAMQLHGADGRLTSPAKLHKCEWNWEMAQCLLCALISAVQHCIVAARKQTRHSPREGALQNARLANLGMARPIRLPIFTPNLRRKAARPLVS
jgi:hypothetical protein